MAISTSTTKKTPAKAPRKRTIPKSAKASAATKKTPAHPTGTYIEGIGRRKTASARVRLIPTKEMSIVVNDKPIAEYFIHTSHQKDILSVLETKDAGIGTYFISAHVYGGGLSSQAEAVRLGIARALVKEKADRRSPLKQLGFLKRDPRSVERKKFGLLKARRRPQWSKR